MKYCPECGAKFDGEPKFCPECGINMKKGPDSVINRSSVETSGELRDSVVNRSEVKMDKVAIKDAVISHSTITQTETHQHFGESVGTYDTQMELGKTAFEGKNWEESVEFFNAALKINSKMYEPWFLKGISCAELGRVDEAATNLKRGLKLEEGGRGRLIDEVKKVTDTIYRRAVVGETQAGELLGKAKTEMEVSYETKNIAARREEESVVQALGINIIIPGFGTARHGNAAVESMEKRQDARSRELEARKLQEQAKDILSAAVKQYNAAIRYCDVIVEFDRADEFAHLRKGEIFFRLKLYGDACKAYESLLCHNPNHRDALRLRGMCYKAQGLPIPPPPEIEVPVQKDCTPAPSTQAKVVISDNAGDAPLSFAPISSKKEQAPQMMQRPQSPIGPSAPPASYGQPGHPSQTSGAYVQGRPQAAAPPPARQQRVPVNNPCPFCRADLTFIQARNVWHCSACKRYCDRPGR